MAVNQSQVDHIITAASEDDPEVKLQNLEREVDLIKTSIKRLLMDIRERMNELENPFTISAAMGGGGSGSVSVSAESEAKLAALEAKEAALEAREAELSAAKTQVEAQKHEQETRPVVPEQPAALPVQPAYQPVASQQTMIQPQPAQYMDERRAIDEQLLAQFRAQLTGTKPANDKAVLSRPSEKFRLQKVYKLFKWTNQAVRKYGHDRLEIMLQTYKTMGYISKESAEEIREIARLMPANIGEEHEVGPDEFVSELYTLNRIIAPDDTTLDRDMIEVMMEQRIQVAPAAATPVSPRIEFPATPAKEKRSLKDKEFEEDWMNLPDRI
jgi:Tfp pilus assembly protein PilX